MKLQFIKASDYHNARDDYNVCHISKTGNFRFKKAQERMLSIEAGMHFVPALDEDEVPKRTIWFFEENGREGYNVIKTKTDYHMAIRSILVMAGIALPATCKISKVTETIGKKEYTGFKLTFDI